jgi:hypothetical protein
MRISTCNSTVKIKTVLMKSLEERILELESLLLMMISQVKSISKRLKLFKLMLKPKSVKLKLREEMEVMVLLLLITLHSI